MGSVVRMAFPPSERCLIESCDSLSILVNRRCFADDGVFVNRSWLPQLLRSGVFSPLLWWLLEVDCDLSFRLILRYYGPVFAF